MIGYEQDLYAWTRAQIGVLQAREFDKLDVAHLIEELDYMARKDRKELVSRLVILLMHLLKWQFQPDKQTRSWVATLKVQRINVKELLEESPSLKYELRVKFDEAYQRAILDAVRETNLPEETFPVSCPYTLEQVLDESFYPNE